MDPITGIVLCALAFVLGALLTYLIAGRKAQEDAAVVRSRLEAESKRRMELESLNASLQTQKDELERRIILADERLTASLKKEEELKAFLEGSKKELQGIFGELARKNLRENSGDLLQLAKKDLFSPLQESLEKLQKRTQELENARTGAYAKTTEQIESLKKLAEGLQEKTLGLTHALRSNRIRGRWGETALRNIVEFAGMTEHCDFVEQSTLESGSRPDMTIKLPGKGEIAVDSKVPMDAYFEAIEATEEDRRKEAQKKHAQALKSHVRLLSSREYARQLDSGFDMVVLFLPSEPVLGAALEKDPDILNDALGRGVLLASPTTLVALLKTVAIYWREKSIAENNRLILDAAKKLYERAAKFQEEFARVGRGLGTAVDAYNSAAGSFTKRLLPAGKDLEDMRITDHAARELSPPPPVGKAPKQMEQRPFSPKEQTESERAAEA